MRRTIFLDSGVLSRVANPGITAEVVECNRWLQVHARSGIQIIIPEITDYEVRRELIRAGKSRSLTRLDGLQQMLPYAPITTAIISVRRNSGPMRAARDCPRQTGKPWTRT